MSTFDRKDLAAGKALGTSTSLVYRAATLTFPSRAHSVPQPRAPIELALKAMG
jgi:hypothetical protein